MPTESKYGHIEVEKPPESPFGDDEPIVLFRAQDVFLPALLRTYATLCETGGSPKDHLDGVASLQMKVEEWQSKHSTKIPD